MTQVVDSYNFFINSDRNHGEDTQGDQTRLNLGLQPIVCGDDEFIRLSLHMFAMRRSWTDINETNSQFVLWYTPPGADLNVAREPYAVNLEHINTSSGFDALYEAITVAVDSAFIDKGLSDHYTVKYKTYDSFKASIEYQSDVRVKYRPRLLLIITDLYEEKRLSGDSDFASYVRPSDIQLPAIQCNIFEGDSYLLFGGARCHSKDSTKPADSNEGIAHIAPYYVAPDSTPDIYLDFPYNYSRRTQKMAYITTTQVNSNIATDSYTAGFFDTKKGIIESSQIMAAIPMQDEYLFYEAPTDHNYFVNFTSKQANMLEFNIVDAFGRRFPLISSRQSQDGNRSFEMCVRVDRCKRPGDNPYDLDTKPPVKPTPPRFSNGPAANLRRGIPGTGLNEPGQVYGDGYKPMFK